MGRKRERGRTQAKVSFLLPPSLWPDLVCNSLHETVALIQRRLVGLCVAAVADSSEENCGFSAVTPEMIFRSPTSRGTPMYF